MRASEPALRLPTWAAYNYISMRSARRAVVLDRLNVVAAQLFVARRRRHIRQQLIIKRRMFSQNALKATAYLWRRLGMERLPIDSVKERVRLDGGVRRVVGTKANRGVVHEHALDELLRLRGESLWDRVLEPRNLLERLVLVGALEGRPAGQQLVDDAAPRPHVRPGKRQQGVSSRPPRAKSAHILVVTLSTRSSGETYSAVPTNELARTSGRPSSVGSSLSILAVPKSVILTCILASSRMFSGLMSRWMISSACKYSMAVRISAA